MRAVLVHRESVDLDVAELRLRIARPVAADEEVPGDQGVLLRETVLKPASVLVPIVVREDQFTVLFTRRTAHLRAHSGQISFPGGRTEPGDPSPVATALRESAEEIGLLPDQVDVVGCLGAYRTGTGYRVTPVVGIVHPPLDLRPDANEVEEVFEVPLSFMLDPANHLRHSRVILGELRWFYAIEFGDYYIWGATAGMIVNLYRHLAR
ncbi:MAG: CoA pyrophosphatase [Betaproteobacteria bacterium]|nr:CoA pyrophosphatase [Betaproteobacteria bacterium]